MLQFLREKNVKKIMLWALAILIIPAFALTGVAYLNSNKKYVAKMYGQKIFNSDFIEFQRMFGAYLKLNFGPRFELNLNSEKMYNDLWENFIITQKAKKDGIQVEDNELLAFLQTLFAMNAGGEFNQAAYLGFLKQANIVPAQFERFLKGMIASQKLVEQRAEKITVNDEQALDDFKKNNETAKIEYIFISERETQKFLEIYTDNEILKNHYEKNKDSFMALPEAQVRYILADELPEDFDIEKTKTLDDVAKTLNKEVQSSEFFNVQSPMSEGIPAGSFAVQAAIEAKLNTLVGPIPLDSGKIFFEKNAQKDSYQLEFDQALEKVKKSYAYKNAIKKAEEIAKSVFDEISSNNDFKIAADKFKLKNVTTELFKIEDEIDDKLLAYPPFNKAIFELSENKLLGEPFRFDYGWCIAKRLEFNAYDSKKYEEEKEGIKAALLAEAKKIDYEKLLNEIQEESNLEFNRNQ